MTYTHRKDAERHRGFQALLQVHVVDSHLACLNTTHQLPQVRILISSAYRISDRVGVGIEQLVMSNRARRLREASMTTDFAHCIHDCLNLSHALFLNARP
jgi:hypothetical protein